MRILLGKSSAALVLLLSACQLGVKEPPPFDWQGHRGARGTAPENSVPAMQQGLQAGVKTLEMDVVISADSVVLLSHEPFMHAHICSDSLSKPILAEDQQRHNIYKMRYEQILKYDCGSRGHPQFRGQEKYPVAKPSLLEVLSMAEQTALTMNRPAPFYNIEIKSHPGWDTIFHPKVETYVDLVVQAVAQSKLRERVILQSFDLRALRYMHRQYPQYNTALLVDEKEQRTPQELFTSLGYMPKIYSPHYTLVTASLLRELKLQKVQVIPWTVNEILEAKRLMELGVDGIITDFPNRLISSLGRSSNAQIE